jgi:hypothetical protein
MQRRLVWSLGNRRGEEGIPHPQFVYDMFYLSIKCAKDLGYHTVFYGTHESVSIIGKWVDEVHDITNKFPYIFYDDIKVWLWYNDPNCTTIDGDVFLYRHLSFRETEDVAEPGNTNSIDYSNLAWDVPNQRRRKPVTLRYEEFDIEPPKHDVRDALRYFNSLNPQSVIPEWDNSNTSSLNTGIINWNNLGNEFKIHYCTSYAKLREWYFKNETKLSEYSPLLNRDNSVLAHFMCEHLMYQLVRYHTIKIDKLKDNPNNHYIHLKGGTKFKDMQFINSLTTLVNYHKSTGGYIIDSHTALVNRRMIRPFLYLRDKFT